MADRGWIKRVVNTAGRKCPILGAKCPGTQRGCAFWVQEVLQDGRGSADVQGGCLFSWQYILQHETMVETQRGQAGVDKMATQIALRLPICSAVEPRPIPGVGILDVGRLEDS